MFDLPLHALPVWGRAHYKNGTCASRRTHARKSQPHSIVLRGDHTCNSTTHGGPNACSAKARKAMGPPCALCIDMRHHPRGPGKGPGNLNSIGNTAERYRVFCSCCELFDVWRFRNIRVAIHVREFPQMCAAGGRGRAALRWQGGTVLDGAGRRQFSGIRNFSCAPGPLGLGALKSRAARPVCGPGATRAGPP
jgi:hypothetical protein